MNSFRIMNYSFNFLQFQIITIVTNMFKCKSRLSSGLINIAPFLSVNISQMVKLTSVYKVLSASIFMGLFFHYH